MSGPFKGSRTLDLFATAYAIGAECARAAWDVASREDRARAEWWQMTGEDIESLHRDLPESVVRRYRSEMDTALEHGVTGCDETCEHNSYDVAEQRHRRAAALEREADRGYAEEISRLVERAADEAEGERNPSAPCGGDCAGCG